MSDARPAPAGQQREEGTLKKVFGVVQQVFIVYALAQFAGKFIKGKVDPTKGDVAAPGQPVTPGAPDAQAGIPVANADPRALPPDQVYPAWPQGVSLDLHVHLSTDPFGQVFAAKRTGRDADLPSFAWHNISYGNWSDARLVDLEVPIPQSVQHNGSMWADIFLTMANLSPDPEHPKFDARGMFHMRKLLTRYMPKPKIRKEKKLLGVGKKAEVEDDEEEEEADEEKVIASYWYPNMTLALVSDGTAIPYAQLPPPVKEHVQLVPNARDDTGKFGYYYPVLFPNEFWHLRSHLIELNETTPVLPLQVTYQALSYMKFQLFASLTAGFETAAQQQGGASGAELDEIKRVLLETNPWYLGLTGLVSMLHVVFEMLAFTSDVSHWRTKKELVGVSVRTIVINVITQIIVLLYLVDNNEETSWMILMSSGMGVLIEAWKITKAVDVAIVPASATQPATIPGIPFHLQITDKHVLSEDEKKTQEYDKLAFRYVSWVTIPCLLGYSVYSLLYESHRGWYSYVITTLTSFVYMFGFAQLVPQLIINYKLKSVAHMPMKAMVYKTLSTVIDDMFAFIIKMPILHRLACFRDDVVFLVFLYQRWIYRIDPNRVNEYGQVMATDVDALDATKSSEATSKGPAADAVSEKPKEKESKKKR
ncbi:cleft lip and palate associated transmembrane protein [Peniophora sp. CONT]|nr:cleft lip and palate associated transmembrane protein [Peniophora sp. CONT]